jgi:hypothetical protein
MKASELVKQLQTNIDTYGDLDICTIHDDMCKIERNYRIFTINCDENSDADDWELTKVNPNHFGIEVE